jgi:hypothetical protein
MFRLADLKRQDEFEFVAALFIASNGDADVKAMLLEAPFDRTSMLRPSILEI